jgi:hypothetical protein
LRHSSMNTLRDDLNEVIRTEKIEGIEFVRIHDWQWVLEKLANEFYLELNFAHGVERNCQNQRGGIIWIQIDQK